MLTGLMVFDMFAKVLLVALSGLLLSSCVISPVEHSHYRPVPVPASVVVASPVRINAGIIRYRDVCDQSLLRNAYVPACDQYIKLTAGDVYLSDHRIRQTRERFLRHRHRHEQSRIHAGNIALLSRYQRQCDKAIEKHDYVPACDRFIQLSMDRKYQRDRNVRAVRAEYQAYKKDYKKSRRNIRMYKKQARHESGNGSASSRVADGYLQYKKPVKEKATDSLEQRLKKYRQQCDKGLSKKHYKLACDQYLNLTAYKVYLGNKDIRTTRERYLRFKKRYKKMPIQHE